MYPSADSELAVAYKYVLDCGSVHDVKAFGVKILETLNCFCPYDQGRIYYYSESGKICDQYLVNIPSGLVDVYHSYYSKVDNGRYGMPAQRQLPRTNVTQEFGWLQNSAYVTEFSVPLSSCSLQSINWNLAPRGEFVKDYIRYIGLSHSMGFGLYDANDSLRLLFMLDRTSRAPYTQKEVSPLCLAVPQLENLYRSFSYRPKKPEVVSAESYRDLTAREAEITTLLCGGMDTADMCSKLHISRSTLYSHIAHIFRKMQVSSRQELMAKILGSDIE